MKKVVKRISKKHLKHHLKHISKHRSKHRSKHISKPPKKPTNWISNTNWQKIDQLIGKYIKEIDLYHYMFKLEFGNLFCCIKDGWTANHPFKREKDIFTMFSQEFKDFPVKITKITPIFIAKMKKPQFFETIFKKNYDHCKCNCVFSGENIKSRECFLYNEDMIFKILTFIKETEIQLNKVNNDFPYYLNQDDKLIKKIMKKYENIDRKFKGKILNCPQINKKTLNKKRISLFFDEFGEGIYGWRECIIKNSSHLPKNQYEIEFLFNGDKCSKNKILNDKNYGSENLWVLI